MTPELLYEWVAEVTPNKRLAQTITGDLVKRYSEPHRRWHGLNHLDMLNNVSNIKNDGPIRESLILAVLFHDAVYDVSKTDNEERSADIFEFYYPQHQFKTAIYDAIISTKTGKDLYNWTIISDNLNDWDRAILYETDYNKLLYYENAIAAEYMTVYNRSDYLKGRIEFLRKQTNTKLHELADELEKEYNAI